MNDRSFGRSIVPIAPIGWNEGGTLRIEGHGIDPDRRNTMKTLTLALATVLGIAFVAPITAAQAQETKKVIIKRGHDRGHHFGWREHRHHGGNKVVIIKKRRHHEM
jgi:hypothetical protein